MALHPSRDTPLRTIDIGLAGHLLRFVGLGNYYLLVGCGTWAFGLATAIVQTPGEPGPLIFLPLLIYCAWVGWRNIGVLEAVVDRHTTAAFVILVTMSSVLSTVYILDLAERHEFPDAAGTRETFAAAVSVGLFAVSSIPGLIALACLRSVRIHAFGQRLADLVWSRLTVRKSMPAVRNAAPRDLSRGIICLLCGLLWFVAFYLFWQPERYFSEKTYLEFSQMFHQVRIGLVNAGFALLIYARHYLRADYQSLRAADTRQPIVLLRSFADDEKVDYQQAEAMLFNFSLESRLADVYESIGPLIAVGAPGDVGPRFGATRAVLEEQTWQPTVLDWMRESRLIILMAGTTPWIAWELQKTLHLGYENKLLLLFPRSKKWFWRRRADAAARLDVVRRAVAGTVWEAGVARCGRATRIRCLVLQPDGTVVQVVSSSRSIESYQLAALIGEASLTNMQLEAPGTLTLPPRRRALITWAATLAALAVVGLLSAILVARFTATSASGTLAPLPAAMKPKASGTLLAGNFKLLESRDGSERPSADFRPGDWVHIVYELRGYGRDGNNAANLKTDITLVDAFDRFVTKTDPLQFHEPISEHGSVKMSYSLRLPPQTVGGRFTLKIAARDMVNGNRATFAPTVSVSPSKMPPFVPLASAIRQPPDSPLTVGNVAFQQPDESWVPTRSYAPGDLIVLAYEVVGYTTDAQGKADMRIQADLYDAAGSVAAERMERRFNEFIRPPERANGWYKLQLSSEAPAGTYTIAIQIHDVIGSATTEFTQNVEVRPPKANPLP